MIARRHRQGTATVEFVVCLPILVALITGINEICSAIYLKEQVTIAAYEGARVGIQREATNEMVRGRVMEVLDERGIAYAENDVVEISTPGFDDADTMAHVTTTVTVPIDGNSLTGGWFTDQFVSGSVTLRKEFSNL